MLTNIIKEFLVRVGYDIDKDSEKDFTSAITGATKLMGGLGGAVDTTAGAVILGVQKMSEALEKFYFVAQRSNASVAGIKAAGFAGSQLGVAAEEVQSSIEGLGKFLRTNPLAKSFIEGRLGVKTNNADGSKRDTSAIMADLGKSLSSMPLYMANAYAATLGLSEKTVLALREGMGGYINYYQGLLSRLGVNEEEAAKTSHGLMIEWRNVQGILAVLGDKIVQLLGPRLTASVSHFRDMFERNFTRISEVLASAARWVLDAADMIDRFVYRGVQGLSELYDWFEKLPAILRYVLEAIAGLMIAFSFFDWPILLVGALGSALLALYDDYKTWKEGGKHLINWGYWQAQLDTAGAYIKGWWDWLVGLWYNNTNHIRTAIEILNLPFVALYNHWGSVKTFFSKLWDDVVGIFDAAWQRVKPIVDKVTGAADWIANSKLGKVIGWTAGAAKSVVGGIVSRVEDGASIVAAGADDLTKSEYGAAFGKGIMTGDKSQSNPSPAVADGPPAPPGPGGKAAKSNAQEAFDFWKKQGGFSDAGAAAMTAMESNEGNFDPNAVGDSGLAHGLYQWHKGRRDAIEAKTGIKIDGADANTQRMAMLAEMRDKIDAGAGKAYEKLKNATDPNSAGAIASRLVERPRDADGEALARGHVAADYAARFGGKGDVHIAQANTYNIHGQDAHAISKAVGQTQDTTNAQLVRNMQGAAV